MSEKLYPVFYQIAKNLPFDKESIELFCKLDELFFRASMFIEVSAYEINILYNKYYN